MYIEKNYSGVSENFSWELIAVLLFVVVTNLKRKLLVYTSILLQMLH